MAKVKAKNKSKLTAQQNNNIYHLLPIIFVLCVLPFIMRFKAYDPMMSKFQWFWNVNEHYDYFLYYKQWSLVIVSVIMLLVIIAIARKDKKILKFNYIFIPLIAYELLSFLSFLFSKYKIISLLGSFEQFESALAMLGYGLIIYYSYIFIKDDKDVDFIIKILAISALIMGILGIGQFLGYDFTVSSIGKKIILPPEIRNNANVVINVPEKRVYLSLYNPNYVGSYTALLIPIFTILLFFQKKLHRILLCLLVVIGLTISTIGSLSLTGVIALGASAVLVVIFTWRYLLKRFYIVIPTIIIIICTLFTANKLSDGVLINDIKTAFKPVKSNYELEKMETKSDHVTLTYKGNELKVSYFVTGETALIDFLDGDNKTVAAELNEENNTFTITDERFEGITVRPDPEFYGVFRIRVAGRDWRFIYSQEDGTFYYINNKGKLDHMIKAPSAVFTGYEKLASGRGYIWSRTIPLIKDYIVLGSGPDTFTMAFPQQDYMNLELAGYGDALLTKPHNMYLQIAIETGLLSLIAFLVFYGMYFVQSVRLYISGRFSTYYSQVGVAIFIGTIAYMVTGLANDSSITTAPVFWGLIGIGIAVNAKTKPLILEERKAIKEERRKRKEGKSSEEENNE